MIKNKSTSKKTRIFLTAALAFAFTAFSCKNVKNEAVTGIIVEKNNFTCENLKKNFPNLTSITFKNCKMDDFDMGNIEFNALDIILKEGCHGELIASKANYGIKKLSLQESSIKSISSSFLENLTGLKELSTYYGDLKNISFPQNSSIEKLEFFCSHITDFSSLKNLNYLEDLRISQLFLDEEFDVSSISDLEYLKSAWFSSNFKISPDRKFPHIKKLGFTVIENYNLPSNFSNFIALEELSINNYFDSKFPLYLSELSKLKKLTLFSTDIEEFPSDLSSFSTLENLYFINSKVKDFPKDVVFPQNFKQLCVSSKSFDFSLFRQKHPGIKFDLIQP